MQAVFDTPMLAYRQGELTGIVARQAGDKIAPVYADGALDVTFKLDDTQHLQVLPILTSTRRERELAHRPAAACLHASMTAVYRFIAIHLKPCETMLNGLIHIKFNIFVEVFLITLERQNVVCTLATNLTRNGFLAPHGINGDNRAVQGQQLQQRRNYRYFVRFFSRF